MIEWQDVATAPKDGTVIDVIYVGERQTDVSWRRGDPLRDQRSRAALDSMRPIGWRTKDGDLLPERYITHWMPIPAPPTLAERK